MARKTAGGGKWSAWGGPGEARPEPARARGRIRQPYVMRARAVVESGGNPTVVESGGNPTVVESGGNPTVAERGA